MIGKVYWNFLAVLSATSVGLLCWTRDTKSELEAVSIMTVYTEVIELCTVLLESRHRAWGHRLHSSDSTEAEHSETFPKPLFTLNWLPRAGFDVSQPVTRVTQSLSRFYPAPGLEKYPYLHD